MRATRRAFLQSALAGMGMVALAPRAVLAAAKPVALRAAMSEQAIRAEGPRSEIWGFNGTSPGPVLRFREGDEAWIRVTNAIARPTAVHWHGIRVPNAMDGVPHVTQAPVPDGGTFDYRFRVQDAGTFWYHPHQSAFEQVPRGLYGAFIVEEREALDVDREELWVLSDFKLDAANRPVADFGRLADFGGEGRLGNVIALNGTEAGAYRRLELRPR